MHNNPVIIDALDALDDGCIIILLLLTYVIIDSLIRCFIDAENMLLFFFFGCTGAEVLVCARQEDALGIDL